MRGEGGREKDIKWGEVILMIEGDDFELPLTLIPFSISLTNLIRVSLKRICFTCRTPHTLSIPHIPPHHIPHPLHHMTRPPISYPPSYIT